MKAKEVLLLLTDRWADWEAAYAVSGVNSVPQYSVKTIAADKSAKMSIGGMKTAIDYAIADYNSFGDLAMLIIPGGYSWRDNQNNEIAVFVKRVIDYGIPVSAICGAAIFLGKHGFLDKVRHTGDDLEAFQEERGYNEQDFYIPAQVVVDNGIITANETAAVEFARAIFRLLKIDTDEEIDDWYDYFKYGMVRQ